MASPAPGALEEEEKGLVGLEEEEKGLVGLYRLVSVRGRLGRGAHGRGCRWCSRQRRGAGAHDAHLRRGRQRLRLRLPPRHPAPRLQGTP